MTATRALAGGLVAALVLLAGAAYWDEPAQPPAEEAVATASLPGPLIAAAPAAAPNVDPAARAVPAPEHALDDLLRQSKLAPGWLVAHGLSSGAALQRLHALLDARTELAGAPRYPLRMQPSGASAGDSHAVPKLAAQERYVLASLANAALAGEDSVLVRWRRLGDDAVMELSAQAMPTGGEPLEFWMHTPADWAPGSYRLEVISATPELAPLAVGEFEIVDRGAAVTAFSYPLQTSAAR